MGNVERGPEEYIPGQIVQTVDAHGVWVAATRWCAQLQFVTPVEDSEKGVQDRIIARVNVDWPLAKALLHVLGQAIAGYEEVEGTISLPKSFTNPPREAAKG